MSSFYCIQCRARPAEWVERRNSRNVYCGRLCHMQYHLVGLRGFDDEIIGLEAADGTRIRITADQARQMKTIELLLEDSSTKDYIPLPNIDGRTLLQIQSFLQNDRLEQNSYDLIELLRAANYLDYERLIYYLMPEWVNNPQLFPQPAELKGLIPDALYFYMGYDFENLNVDLDVKRPFLLFFHPPFTRLQWNIRMAASNGRLAVVDRLLQDPRVDPAAIDNYAIAVAALNGHVQVVDRLLQDPRVDPTADDNAAIRYAATLGHVEVVERLLQADAVDPTALDNKAIISAADNGHLAVVALLLRDKRADPADEDNEAIRMAARNGHLAVVDQLLQDSRVDPGAYYNSPIRYAAEHGHLAVVDRLLQDSRVDPAAEDDYAIKYAAANGYVAVVDRLLHDERVNPAVDRNTPLRRAAVNGHLAVVERLLRDNRVDPAAIANFTNPAIRQLYEEYHRKRQRVRGMIH